MSVIHILKDGSVLTDITGKVVRKADAETVYKLFETISRRGSRKENVKHD